MENNTGSKSAKEILANTYFLRASDSEQVKIIRSDNENWTQIKTHFEECRHGPNCSEPLFVLTPQRYYHARDCDNPICPCVLKSARDALFANLTSDNRNWKAKYDTAKRDSVRSEVYSKIFPHSKKMRTFLEKSTQEKLKLAEEAIFTTVDHEETYLGKLLEWAMNYKTGL